jgi:hypothetical protein
MLAKINGIRVALRIHDLDKDGISGEIEDVSSEKPNIVPIIERSELGEALEQQNRDILNEERLSSVDFISRINEFQHAPISAIECISAMKVISIDGRLITRIVKRNSCSIQGLGRKEFVDVVVGKAEKDIRKSGLSSLAGVEQKK